MEVSTIGFTKRTAPNFFGALTRAGIGRLIDVRLHNTSQLAGFTKRDDLGYFLRELCGAEYVHEPLLAPTEELLKYYHTKGSSWPEYERRFRRLIAERQIEARLDRRLFDRPVVLLCTEPTADHCHRRLVAEHLQQHWGGLEIAHL